MSDDESIESRYYALLKKLGVKEYWAADMLLDHLIDRHNRHHEEIEKLNRELVEARAAVKDVFSAKLRMAKKEED